MVQIIVIRNKWYHYYDTYDTKKEAIETALYKKKKVKDCKSHIIKTIDGVWKPKLKYKLYLTNVISLKKA